MAKSQKVRKQLALIAEIFKPTKSEYVYAHYSGKIQLIDKGILKQKKHRKLLG